MPKNIKYSFKNDYSDGGHPRILEALANTSSAQQDPYGEDDFSFEVKKILCEKLDDPNADIHFVSGGTQANLIVISSILRPYESVIAANTGHIAVHETGAIEATGHKINIVEAKNGKLSPENIKPLIDLHQNEHMVKPRLVFISNSTEIGSIYMKKELEELSLFCKKNNLILYLDGARLGSALTSKYSDLTLADISKLVDVFYIGGTKNGALIGEVIVINSDNLKKDFRFHLKQKGALLAKGRVFGVQFLELFKDDLFFELGKQGNLMASKLAFGIEKKGFEFLTKPVSNQIFPILPNGLIEKLSEKYEFYVWKKIDDEKSVVRLITSWATKEKFVDQFLLDFPL